MPLEGQRLLSPQCPVCELLERRAVRAFDEHVGTDTAKEHYDRSGDPRDAMIGGLAHSGRVIFAAAAVMVAVVFTFALSGPLPPKEMGVILGIAVLLDAMLVRLILVPTLLRFFGHSAWALPRWLARILPESASDTGSQGAEYVSAAV